MKFSITLTTDSRSNAKSHLIHDLSKKLAIFFENRTYGEDIQDYIIGFTCVFTPEGFKNIFKKENPTYVSDKTKINRFSGEKIRLFKLFIDNITIEEDEYETFVTSNDLDCLELLKTKILESLSNLDKLPKSVKDFDKDKFKMDMSVFFDSYL